MVMAKYHILIEKDEDGGFVGRVPELAGCLSQGDTVDELISNMREAIELCLEVNASDSKFVGIQEIEV